MIGHIGDGFYRSMTQPTVSESTEGSTRPKDRLQSHQVHLTMLQAYTSIQYIHKNESKHSEMGPMRQNPIQRTVRSVHMCVHCTVHNCCTQYYTEQTWQFSLLPSRSFALRPHHGSMVDIQSLTAEIRRGNKKRRKKQDENIMVCPIP